MPIEIDPAYLPTYIKDKPNYSAYLSNNFDNICKWKGWNTNTQKKYEAIYNHYILPIINLNKPIEDFDNIDFLMFCNHVFEDNYSDFSSGYIEQIVYLFGCVYEYGVYHGEFEDNLFISQIDDVMGSLEDSKVIKKREKLAVTRSFTVRSQILITLWIKAKDPLVCSHFELGFIIMFFAGMRVNESCGLVFGNVKMICDGSVPSIIVARSTKIKSREHKPGSKTKNADRIIPIPGFLFEFIQKRREKYLNAGFSDDEIDLIPVISDDKGTGISAVELSSYIRILFRNFKIGSGKKKEEIFSSEQFASLIIDLNQQRKNTADSNYLGEKDLTAYVLRRNFATMNSSIGLSDQEVQYIMGHEVEGDVRSFYLNDDQLSIIAEKMSHNPLYSFWSAEPLNYHESERKFRIEGNSRVYIRIETVEPFDGIGYHFEGNADEVETVSHYSTTFGRRDDEPNILEELVTIYRETFNELKNEGYIL